MTKFIVGNNTEYKSFQEADLWTQRMIEHPTIFLQLPIYVQEGSNPPEIIAVWSRHADH